jgi:TPR repeat protein
MGLSINRHRALNPRQHSWEIVVISLFAIWGAAVFSASCSAMGKARSDTNPAVEHLGSSPPRNPLIKVQTSIETGNQLSVPFGGPPRVPPWFKSLDSECAQGYQPLCTLVDELYLDGRFIQSDPARARAYLDQSCDIGKQQACDKLGRANPYPTPPAMSEKQNQSLIANYQAVVNESDCGVAGNSTACYFSGVAYLTGAGVPLDRGRGQLLLDKACQKGQVLACKERDCSSGSEDACVKAAAAYASGTGGFVDLSRTKELLDASCGAGYAPACEALKSLPATPKSGPASKDIAALRNSLEYTSVQATSCDQKRGESCHILGVMFLKGVDVRRDRTRAIRYLQQGCDETDPSSCSDLARLLSTSSHVVETAKAQELFRHAAQLNQRSCDLGVPPITACYDLGRAYAKGEGVPKDEAKAIALMSEACSFWQFGFACRSARELQSHSTEPPGPEEKALPPFATNLAKYNARDCEGGGLPACESLGKFYALGHGVTLDTHHASDLLQRACMGGVTAACSDLTALPDVSAVNLGTAELCKMGKLDACIEIADQLSRPGPSADLERAADFYTQACESQVHAGCIGLVSLGDRFNTGTSAPSDTTRAQELYRTSCILRTTEACSRLVSLGNVLEGAGGTTNEDKALDVFLDACSAGNFPGCEAIWKLAQQFRNATPPNLERTRFVWNSACKRRSSAALGACTNLGIMMEKAEGGPENRLGALQLYDSECRRGYSPACAAYYNLEGSLNTSEYTIEYPSVDRRVTEYRSITFKPYDEFFVRAGGCVQTGGLGKTWKRYVDPSGDNTDSRYFGTIWIPGGTSIERISGVIGKWRMVLPIPHSDASQLFLRLGYADDDNHYPDNGYYSHDDGTEDQCRGVGAAWVIIDVRHHDTPPPESYVPANQQTFPLDLVWSELDDNAFPLNPEWQAQKINSSARPEAGTLCNYFDDKDDRLSLGSNCTSQGVSVDAPSLSANRVNFFICKYTNIDQIDPITGSSVHGHVNWFPVTYTGTIYFDDFQDPFLGSVSMPLGSGDDDYDWALVTPEQRGLVAGNRFQYRNVGPHGMTLELDSREVIDPLDSGWWKALHEAVDSHPPYVNDWTAAQSLVDGRPAIVIGLIGIDTKHTYHTELHPVYAMAIRLASGSRREHWAIFARNWGDEGGCSQDQHYIPTNSLSFFFPNQGGDDYIVDEKSTYFKGKGGSGLSWGAKNFSDGLVLTFNLPPPDQQGLAFGELELCKGACDHNPLNIASTLPVPSAEPTSHETEAPALKIDEGSVKPLLDAMTVDQRTKMFQLLGQDPKSAYLLQPPHISHASIAALLSAPMPASTLTRKDNIVVRRHRSLAADELATPVNELREPDIESRDRAKRIFEALKKSVGGEDHAMTILKSLGGNSASP